MLPREMTTPSSKSSGSAPSEKQEQEEQRYSVVYLAEHATALLSGVPREQRQPAFIEGALSRESKKTFTIDEAKAALKAHAKTPVEYEGTLPGDEEEKT